LPSEILNTQDVYDAKVPFREKMGFPRTMTRTVTKAVRERQTGMHIVGNLERELFYAKQMVREIHASGRSAGPHEDHVADFGSQHRRSSVASTEAPTRYPVDDVHDIMKECELHHPMGNISLKEVIGPALPCKPGALHHNNPIADGYARVTVDDIVQGCEDLEIDYATPEGDLRLRDVKRHHSIEKEVHQVSRRGAKATDLEESPKSTLLRWWLSTYTSFTSADAAPQFISGG
jgi:hypothetical protein